MTATQTFFLQIDSGQRFCIFHIPKGRARSLVLHVHPFAEELNKTRRMVALQARALAAAGHAVLQIDLLGCGDSSGDFADATWQAWVDDVRTAHAWLARTTGADAEVPVWLWGLRAGCLLATDAAAQMASPCHLLFWQPSFADGTVQLQQFLRLRHAAEMLSGTAHRTGPEDLKQRLVQGLSLEVAGYTLTAELASGLQGSRLRPVSGAQPVPRRLAWLEVSGSPVASLSPLAARTLDDWRNAGWDVDAQAVGGPAFWQSAEIEEAPALLEATVQALTEGAPA